MMIYGSVCSGIEAATVAWHPLGWRAAFYSEIEPFPCALLSNYYPTVPNHGDMTKFKEWPDATLDVLVGGTPCQSFSVAGLRKGLDDPRGNLTLVYLAIAARYRPRWLVWENVPGVLSDRTGAFGAFLGGLGELGYGFAYRVLDAQYFGVPQRRRRVFVVGCAGGWHRAAAVLFERHSLQGHPAPRREQGKGTAPTLAARTRGGGGLGTDFDCDGGLVPFADVAPTLNAHFGSKQGLEDQHIRGGVDSLSKCLNAGGMGRQDWETETLIPTTGGGFDVAGTMKANSGGGGWSNSVDHAAAGYMVPVGFNARQDHDSWDDRTGPLDTFATQAVATEVMTLAIRGRGDSHQLETRSDGTANAILTPNGGRAGIGVGAVAFAQNQRDEVRLMDIAGALAAEPGTKQQTYASVGMQVRRLTPRECERLQGFPPVRDILRITVCEDENKERALSVRRRSQPLNHEANGPVAVHVLIDSERKVLQIHSLGKLLWSASIAANENSYLLRLPTGDFARLVAGMKPMLDQETQTGVAEFHQNTNASIAPSSGSGYVLLSGQEINAFANDVERFARETQRFITSQAGQNSQTSEQRLKTLSCCVAVAINGCIPDSMRNASSYTLVVEVVTPYTLVEYRKKPAADGPRYKALGNSMAVPVMSWIGRRIQEVEEIA